LRQVDCVVVGWGGVGWWEVKSACVGMEKEVGGLRRTTKVAVGLYVWCGCSKRVDYVE
jgi:hypothetical protein